ncbi:putative 1-aminocyclopropane-1-carboxylate synthase [Diplogelasinospora grovesii]|uniref:1-aminocyclopropane-1-carboxylate synthase n=1 Tax=Diplogelasinospora grovesii TaxID=303347 RepID=A0AAN6N0W0_9PEZI|nr:putative 1-aminocyclopropane-1-carboxylate synthase [Diplogelasinospora grovesii]
MGSTFHTSSPEENEVQNAAVTYGLSQRGAYNKIHMNHWDLIGKMLGNPWTPDNPDGLVLLGVAENALMHREVAEFIEKHMKVDPIKHLTYGSGPRGSPRLRKALAKFLDNYLLPCEDTRPEDLIILQGVSGVLDSLTWAVCDDGEGVIIPRPFYTGFQVHFRSRARATIVPASFQDIPGYQDFDDIFRPDFVRKAFENALRRAQDEGVRVRAVCISNPHNPLGRCYPVDTLIEILNFCGRHDLHLFSDEIYANSVFQNHDAPGWTPFTSMLSLSDRIDPKLLHVGYGASKDWCANGLRIGALHTRNKGMQRAIADNSSLTWSPYIVQDLWAAMLEDEDFTSSFLKKNRTLLAEQHAIAARFLDRKRIPYYRNSNAGVFIWIDLRHFLYKPSPPANGETETRRLKQSDADTYKQREMEIVDRCLQNGVSIAHGSDYYTETLGWFRLVFTCPKEGLEVGLERIWKTLQELEAEWKR